MAYRAKYRYTIEANGVTHQLVIAKKDYSGSETSLNGLLQSIRIQRLGDSLIESPIVKSALTFTLVDRDGGMWEEFFTPDATEYKVTFLTDSNERWTGYITPDSYEEDLVYRGSISITARDMIGHMADIPFDKSHISGIVGGTFASVHTLIGVGLSQANVAMGLDIAVAGERTYMKDADSNTAVPSWLVDIRSLEGKNWYEIVEGLLDSLGLVMRWEDDNEIVVTSIQDVPMGGRVYADSNPEYNIQFWNRSGHRSLEPAFRMIDEVLDYKYHEEERSEWKSEDYTGIALNGRNGWWNGDNSKRVSAKYVPDTFPTEYADVSEEDAKRYMFLFAVPETNPSNGTFMYRDIQLAPQTKYKLSFNLSRTYSESKTLDFALSKGRLPHGVLEYSVRWTCGSGTYYLREDGTWDSEGGFVLTYTPPLQGGESWGFSSESFANIEKEFTTPNEAGSLRIVLMAFKHRLRNIGTADMNNYWLRLGDMVIETETKALPKDLKVKTNYDPRQNYTLNRKPMFGKTPAKVAYGGLCLNGFYANRTGYPSIQRARIGYGSDLPLPVVVDMEILSRHTSTTSVITGTIADKQGRPLFMNAIWWFGDSLMILQAGSYDPIRNCIEGAILREFLRGNNWSATDYEIK